MKNVFQIDVETCPHCGGHVKVISAIQDGPVIRRILDHLDLPPTPPKIFPARAPPADQNMESQEEYGFLDQLNS